MDNFKKDRYSSMDSEYHFSTQASRVGATASPQTPNQIGELTSRLNQGLKAVEIGTMNQRILDQIPKEHFTEIKRLGELTGSKASIHAPIQDLDLAGFTQQGQNEFERQQSVEQLKSVIDRAHLLDNEGNVPITVHAGTFPAQKWKKTGLHGWNPEKGGTIEEGKTEVEDKRSEMGIVNQDTGQIQLVRYDEKEMISGKKEAWTPERRLQNLNQTSWDQEQLQILQMKKDFNEVQDRFKHIHQKELDLLEAGKEKKILTEDELKKLAELKQEERNTAQYRKEIHQQTRSMAEEMYSRFNKYKTKDGNIEEKQMQEKFNENIKTIAELQKNLDKLEQEREKIDAKFEEAKTKSEKEKIIEQQREKYNNIVRELSETYHDQTELLVRNFENMPAPNTWVSADNFAKEKVSDSVAEAALHAYSKYGDKAPIISMENVYPEFTLSRANSLKETIEESREKFAKRLMETEKISEKKAKEAAEKIIGVTWDVGHIYQLKKSGYSDEDIEKEAKKIGALVKHIHLTDNFGFEDSHLPPGEGSANIKEQLKAIEKSLGKEEYKKTRAIVEAGEFVANFKEVPHLYALSDLNSPLYTEKTGPYWKDIWDSAGHYFTGFGEMMPQKYFDLYGAPGFSQLPSSLGGSAGSPERGRLASSPNTEENN